MEEHTPLDASPIEGPAPLSPSPDRDGPAPSAPPTQLPANEAEVGASHPQNTVDAPNTVDANVGAPNTVDVPHTVDVPSTAPKPSTETPQALPVPQNAPQDAPKQSLPNEERKRDGSLSAQLSSQLEGSNSSSTQFAQKEGVNVSSGGPDKPRRREDSEPHRQPPRSRADAPSPEAAAAAKKNLEEVDLRINGIMKQIDALQTEGNTLEREEVILRKKTSGITEENAHLSDAVVAAESELRSVSREADELAEWLQSRDVSASPQDYHHLQEAIRTERLLEMQIEEKKMHLEAVIQEAHHRSKEVEALKSMHKQFAVTAEQQKKEEGMNLSIDGKVSDGHSGIASYLIELRRMVEGNEMQLAKLNDAQQEVARLEPESAALEKEISQVRAQLEALGVDIPNAPMTQRSKRRVRMAERRAKATVGVAGGAQVPPAAGGPGAEEHAIDLPVGSLKLLTDELGPLRKFVLARGCTTMRLELGDGSTRVMVRGPSSAVAEVRNALQETLDRKRSQSSGIVTFADSDAAAHAERAATRLKEILTEHPSTTTEGVLLQSQPLDQLPPPPL